MKEVRVGELAFSGYCNDNILNMRDLLNTAIYNSSAMLPT